MVYLSINIYHSKSYDYLNNYNDYLVLGKFLEKNFSGKSLEGCSICEIGSGTGCVVMKISNSVILSKTIS